MRPNIVVLVVLAMPPASYAQELPPAPGSDVVARACTACHGLDVITDQRHDAKGWQTIVDAMITNGATVTPQEENAIVDYLARTLPQ